MPRLVRRTHGNLGVPALQGYGAMSEWRTFHDYEVSEFGEIRRVRDGMTRKAGFVPKGWLVGGYRAHKLTINSKKQRFLAHRLVCELWHGAPPTSKHEAAHSDGIKLNNHFSNLRWATRKENDRDRVKHRTDPIGERNPRAKLTNRQVLEIRSLYKGEWGQIRKLARVYGMSWTAMGDICRRSNWRHV